METVLAGGLLSIFGYLISKENNNFSQKDNEIAINKSENPSVKNIYSSNNFNITAEKIKEKKKKHYNKSLDAKGTSKVVGINKKRLDNSNIMSRLADIDFTKEEFRHTNMTPYFGSNITQNTDLNNINIENKLENFTGVNKFYKPKTEVENFADIKNNTQNVFGNENNTDFERTRYVPDKIMNNYLPFKQERVGPGLDKGYSSKPSGGLQQINKREFELPKTVDELRTKCDPKVTYDGRIVDGQKELLPGDIGEVCKNRVDTAYKQTSDMYLRTGNSSNLKESQRPCVDLKETNRSSTTTKTHESNVTSIIKSLTAPLIDTVKLTKKEYTTFNGRPLGNFQNTNPSKLTIYDPNDIARTTIKESTIHNTHTGTLTGNTKTIMYNPDDIARITMRQTTESKGRNGNIGNQKADAYKVADIKAKETDRQFTSDNQYYGIGDSKDEAETSRKDTDNADINQTKEILFKNRKPTKTGVKLYNEIDNTNITHKKLDSETIPSRQTHNFGNIRNEIPSTNNIQLTHNRNIYENENRINPNILSPLKNNPYCKPLNVF